MKTECEEDDIILNPIPENITLNIPSSAVDELCCSTMKTECEEGDTSLNQTPENPTLNIPSSAVEELCCSTCKKYLSREPIYMLPNGSFICGHQCSPDNNLNIVRAVDFERHLLYITFPCSFNKSGCRERVPFNRAIDHESVCIYRIPFCPWKDCLWTGPLLNIKSHLVEEHADIFKDKAIFKIDVDKNAQEIFLVKKGSSVIIIKYLYDTSDGILKYDIRYCNNPFVDSASFKLRLINDSDMECYMKLKRTSCASYDFNFYDMKNAHALNIAKLLDYLGGPNCIAIIVELFFESNININDELLKTLKCSVCARCLTAPLYKINNRTLCSHCAHHAEPSNDDKLLHLVTEVELPCRWKKCEFSGKCKILRKHESECRFKVYPCWFCSAVNKLRIMEAIHHYKEKHNALYTLENINIEININEPVDEIVTVSKNNMLIAFRLVKHANSDILTLDYFSLPTDSFSCIVIIEHQHCTIKAGPYEIHRSKWLKIDLKRLPLCFKNINPTITVTGYFH